MTSLEHVVRADRVVFRPRPSQPDPFRPFRPLRQSSASPSINALVAEDLAGCSALAALRRFGNEHPGAVEIQEREVSASHAAVASLSAVQAGALGLPEPPPFSLKADTGGIIGSASFRLRAEWQRHGQSIVTRRQGPFLQSEAGRFLIPEPLFSAVEMADRFDAAATDLPGHWDALARFRRLFEDAAPESAVELAPFLSGIRIFTAAALGLQLRKETGGITFDPILFGARALDKASEDARPVCDEDGVLPKDLLQRFQRDEGTGFPAFPTAKGSYLLGPNSFLILDGALQTALEVVRQKQQASAEQRRGFAANPRAAISDRLTERAGRADPGADPNDIAEVVEERASRLFVETPEYARRAVDVGAWEPPSSRIGRGDGEPATPAPAAEEEPADAEAASLAEDRDDEKRFPKIEPRGDFGAESGADVEWPARLRSEPFPHQLTCFRWLVASWAAGQPGVLNADDQGLGKTVETLAFLAWLQDVLDSAEELTHSQRRGPILVVAPTGLLRTWEAEVARHLDARGLYAAHRVYGPSLNNHRVRGRPGVDTDDGRCRLHFEAVRAAGARKLGHRQWLLTTFQTLTNYQHSFRQLRFSAVVFDEIQLLKNPDTLRSLAARSIRAEFRIGLTGTPIENRTMDLWSVMDTLARGRLGSRRDFGSRYGEPAEENMRELQDRVFTPQRTRCGGKAPPLAIRRLKEDVLVGLPGKSCRRYRETMPARQAEAYDGVLDLLRSRKRGAALDLLQQLRAVSLHPANRGSATGAIGTTDAGTTDAYVEDSARLARVREILDNLCQCKEKALLFIEDLDMQAFFAQWLRSRYGLRDVPVINGSVPVSRRHEQVRRFQQRDSGSQGFGVFILSPRAAGFGLTLTAATHVVHITRWWNPAVEEQCNDRIYRIGQTRDVTVHLPMAIHPIERERSFDQVLDELLQRKRELARSALWPPAAAERDLSQMMKGVLGPDSQGSTIAPPPRPPELLCRRTFDGWSWTLAIEAPDELEIAEMFFDGEPLERLDGDWEVPSCVGELHALAANSSVHPIELFAGRPLVFRTAADWDGPGRRVRGVGRGHFLVVAPEDWRRRGHPPVEPEPCGNGFLAHYFHFDAHETLDEAAGFDDCLLESVGPGFRLNGNRVFDDLEDCGLFNGTPTLRAASDIRSVRVSAEGADGWQGGSFDPHSTALEAILGEREGAFTLRAYDEGGLRDRGRFRLLRQVLEIRLCEEAYSPETLLVPDERGHQPAAVRLAEKQTPDGGAEWACSSGTSRSGASSPDPEDERVEIDVPTNSGPVIILVRPPRIWWRLEAPGSAAGRWGDRPVELSRPRFLEAADEGQALALQLPRRVSDVRVGFDPTDTRKYKGKLEAGNRLIRLPLRDFRDHDAVARHSSGKGHLHLVVGRHVLELVRVLDEDSLIAQDDPGPRASGSVEQDGPDACLDEPPVPGAPEGAARKLRARVLRLLKRVLVWLGVRRR